jgi:hypothetical protein
MSRNNLFFLSLTLLGLVLFLYGSAFYSSLIGWTGVYFLLGGILAFLLLYIYNGLFTEKKN